MRMIPGAPGGRQSGGIGVACLYARVTPLQGLSPKKSFAAAQGTQDTPNEVRTLLPLGLSLCISLSLSVVASSG